MKSAKSRVQSFVCQLLAPLSGPARPGARPAARLRLEALEDRLQPSLTGLALPAEAHPGGTFHRLDFAVQSTASNGIEPATLNSATYTTGTTGSATAEGSALDSSGNVYVVGTIDDGTGALTGYLAEYNSAGTLIYNTTFQAADYTAPQITFMNTQAHAVAVDSQGDAYVAGTAIDASSGDHNAYTLKFDPTGATIIWANALDGPGNLTTGTSIAVSDPNGDGNGLAVMTGTLSAGGTIGDNLYVCRWNAAGDDVVSGDGGFYYYYTFTGAQGSHGLAVAVNTASTVSTPGSLGIIAGNIVNGAESDTLALEFTNGAGQQGGVWADVLTNAGVNALTGVAFRADDSSAYSGTLSTGVGLVAAYPADGGAGTPLFAGTLANSAALNAVSVDSTGNLYATGLAAAGGAYVVEVDSMGMGFLGELTFGSATDVGNAISVDPNSGAIWVAGNTTSSTLSTDGTTLNGTQDGFLAGVTIP